MKMALKEIMKYKTRYIILGSIIFLISLLTMIISGLTNGLSADNASLIQNMPEGTFYMEESAEENNNFSVISENVADDMTNEMSDVTFFSIQMGEVISDADEQHSIAYTASSSDQHFPAVGEGEIILDSSFEEEGFDRGDTLTSDVWDGEFTIAGFEEQEKYSHSPVGFIHPDDFQEMHRADEFQLAFVEGEGASFDGMQAFDNNEFLNTIPSYSAEMMSLNMITVFLYVISGMLFAIFFYMINVQKIATFGILKAVGVKTITLFKMMWIQMLIITFISLLLAVGISQLFNVVTPNDVPFNLEWMTILTTSAIFTVIGFIGVTISGIQIRKVEPMHAINQGGA